MLQSDLHSVLGSQTAMAQNQLTDEILKHNSGDDQHPAVLTLHLKAAWLLQDICSKSY